MLRSTSLSMLFLFICSSTYTQDYKTITYFKNDTTQLEMDLFLPDSSLFDKSPVFLFVHGGGFSTGKSSSGHNICRYLAERGFVSASISYELYMKGKSFSCDGILPEKIKAIQYAVNDLWIATAFLLKNAQSFQLDSSKVFIGGSSAGAETVLHAIYWDYELMNLYSETIPKTFNYAGLVIGGGAIMDLNLITESKAIPTMLVHGSCDKLVPYNVAAHHYCPVNSSGWLMLYGSYAIFNHLKEMGQTVHLFTYCNGGHNYCSKMFHENQDEVYNFLNKILNKKRFQNHSFISTGKDCQLSGKYHFCK